MTLQPAARVGGSVERLKRDSDRTVLTCLSPKIVAAGWLWSRSRDWGDGGQHGELNARMGIRPRRSTNRE